MLNKHTCQQDNLLQDEKMPIAEPVRKPFQCASFMGAFSSSLDSLMRDHQITQVALSKSTAISQSQISRYLAADTVPDWDSLAALAKHFGNDGVHLIIAYLREITPPHLLNQVSITASDKSSKVPDEAPSAIAKLPRRTQAVFERLAELCVRKPQWVNAIESMMELNK